MGEIDCYAEQLSRALVGPRRAKADLVTEARHSLLDAADAHQARGHSRPEAERLAVADFGILQEILPGYQAELALAQLRRTSLLLFTVLVAQIVIWGPARRGLLGETDPVSGLPAALDGLLSWLGFLTLLGAAAAVFAWKRLPTRSDVTALAGRAALVLSIILALLGAAMAATSGGNLMWAVAFGMAPMVWTAASARRCLRAAR